MNVYEYAARIRSNIRLTSDSIGIEDCYWLCANKQFIDDLRSRDPQVIWGRRGTGKTTLLKALVYDVNYKRYAPDNIAFYIMMASMVPTKEEIEVVTGDGSMAVYVFSKLIGEICNQLAGVFDARCGAMSDEQETAFLEAYFQLVEYIGLYQTQILGGDIKINRTESEEITREVSRNFEVEAKPFFSILGGCFEFLRKHNKASMCNRIVGTGGLPRILVSRICD